MSEIDRLLDIMARLRDPQTGCPWDVEQDFQTIAPYTVEEAFEVADAIARDLGFAELGSDPETVELFDFRADPLEQVELSAGQPEIAARGRDQLERLTGALARAD